MPSDQVVVEALRYRLEQLERAVEAHGRIGQALGVLMGRYQISDSCAFAALARVSQQHNLKLRALAEAVIVTATAPGHQLPRELAEAVGDLMPEPPVPASATTRTPTGAASRV